MDELKQAMKTAFKFAIKAILRTLLPLLAVVVIVVFILVMLMTFFDFGSSTSSEASTVEENLTSISTSGTTIYMDFIAGWESPSSFNYLNGFSKDWPKELMTEDKKYFICYQDSKSAGDRNFGYGVCHYTGSAWNNVSEYKSVGIDIKDSKYNNIGSSKLEAETVLKVYKKEIEKWRNYVKVKTKGLNLSENQVNALTAVAYQYGNIGNFVEMYKKYGDTEELRKNAAAIGANAKYYFVEVKPGGNENAKKRGEANWKAFHEGKYIVQGGNELDQSLYTNKTDSSEDKDSNDSKTNINTKLTGESKEKMEKLIARAIEIANDVDYQYYTYSQANRYGKYSYDCSSFCARLYKKYFNKNIPGTTGEYGSNGYIGSVGNVDLQPGDILWRSGHVELYIGNNKRAGAHTDKYAPKDQISIKTGISGFDKVYRFVTK